MWNTVDQIIYFSKWNVRTIENVETATIEQGAFTYLTTDKAIWSINVDNVDFVRIPSKEEEFITGPCFTRILHFSWGRKKTIHNILDISVKDGEFIKFMTNNWDLRLVNKKNVDCDEIMKV